MNLKHDKPSRRVLLISRPSWSRDTAVEYSKLCSAAYMVAEYKTKRCDPGLGLSTTSIKIESFHRGKARPSRSRGIQGSVVPCAYCHPDALIDWDSEDGTRLFKVSRLIMVFGAGHHHGGGTLSVGDGCRLRHKTDGGGEAT